MMQAVGVMFPLQQAAQHMPGLQGEVRLDHGARQVNLAAGAQLADVRQLRAHTLLDGVRGGHGPCQPGVVFWGAVAAEEGLDASRQIADVVVAEVRVGDSSGQVGGDARSMLRKAQLVCHGIDLFLQDHPHVPLCCVGDDLAHGGEFCLPGDMAHTQQQFFVQLPWRKRPFTWLIVWSPPAPTLVPPEL